MIKTRGWIRLCVLEMFLLETFSPYIFLCVIYCFFAVIYRLVFSILVRGSKPLFAFCKRNTRPSTLSKSFLA